MKLSIYIPDNLADRLRVVKDELNVSEVCQAAITESVVAAESARVGDSRQLIAQRLRRTRTPEQQLRDQGVAVGRRWAADAAALVDLKAVADSAVSDRTLGGAWDRVRLWHQTAATRTLGKPSGFREAVVGGIAVVGMTSYAAQPPYIEGFREGARQVWELVRPELEK